jgi:hypothetical protein
MVQTSAYLAFLGDAFITVICRQVVSLHRSLSKLRVRFDSVIFIVSRKFSNT